MSATVSPSRGQVLFPGGVDGSSPGCSGQLSATAFQRMKTSTPSIAIYFSRDFGGRVSATALKQLRDDLVYAAAAIRLPELAHGEDDDGHVIIDD